MYTYPQTILHYHFRYELEIFYEFIYNIGHKRNRWLFVDANLKRSVILEHYQNPKNKGLFEDETYLRKNMNNTSCIDEVDIMAKIEDGKIKDIRFDGEACAICTSSSSIMTDTLIGKTVEEALHICEQFENMIEERKYQEEVLEEAIVYDDIYKQPNRKKCALLSWWGIKELLESYTKVEGEKNEK